MMYHGYIEREKSADYRAAWQTTFLLNAWVEQKIDVSDILPWVPKRPPERTKKMRIESVERTEPVAVNEYEWTVRAYAKTAGIDLDKLTPDELAEVELTAINASIASDLGAPGVRMFGRAPKEWGNFPDD